MKGKNNLNDYKALVDTSSVVAHDLCAQLHVLQFCVDELENFITDDGQKYLKRLSQSANYLNDLVNTFRRQLKINFEEGVHYSLIDIATNAVELVKNHYYGHIDKITITQDKSLSRFLLKDDAAQVMHEMFSLISVYIDSARDANYFENKSIVIEISAKKLNSRFAHVLIDFHSSLNISFENFVKDIEANTPEKGRMRKYIGLNLLGSKLKDDEDKVEGINEGDKLRLILKVALPLVS